MRPSDKAWLTLAAGVLAWDILCPPGEMLSDASARYTAARPVLSRLVVGYTAGHVMHILPARMDLFTMAGNRFGPFMPMRYIAGRLRPDVKA